MSDGTRMQERIHILIVANFAMLVSDVKILTMRKLEDYYCIVRKVPIFAPIFK